MPSPRTETDRVPLIPPTDRVATRTDEFPPTFESHGEFRPHHQYSPSKQIHSSGLPCQPHFVAALVDADTQSLLPPYSEANRFGRHKSEADYLAALRAWAESKQYIDTDPAVGGGLVGFYGDRTLEERRARLEEDRRLRREEREKRADEKKRTKRPSRVTRQTIAPENLRSEQGREACQERSEHGPRCKSGNSRKQDNFLRRMIFGDALDRRNWSARPW